MFTRKTKIAIISMLIVFGLLFAAGAVSAKPGFNESPPEEVLYISDTGTTEDGKSLLCRVELDEANGVANLTILPGGRLPFNHVDTLAATPDGARLYYIDDGPGFPGTQALLGYYDVTAAFTDTVGIVTLGGSNLTGFDQAAFSPEGVFYATSSTEDRLYSINTATAEATEVGTVVVKSTGMPLNISGADIAFGADGVFYLFTNPVGAPRGLYTLSLPPVKGVIFATFVGAPDSPDPFRGLAMRANGFGDIAASTGEDQIHVISKANGQDVIIPLQMVQDGLPFNAEAGDMSNGPLVLCTRTIGYWKNHVWGRSISVLDYWVDEPEGKMVLSEATNKNFSMLFAQLIAAKLNTNNATGIAVIDNAETWLEAQPGLVNKDGSINWYKQFDSRKQKMIATQLKNALDNFNNQYHCEEGLK